MRIESVQTDLLFPANRKLVALGRSLDVSLDEGARLEGLLEEREGLCLYLLGRLAAPVGNVVEIGAYKGRSTWYLARALEDAGSPYRVVSIDPHLSGSAEAYRETIERTGIASRVDARTAFSYDVVAGFDEPIGLLWIDGDHSYDAVRADFEQWFPLLREGGLVAFHDTVGQRIGPTRVVRRLLGRDDVVEVGVMGMITFARKVAPRRRNRLRALAGRAGFELVSLLWRLRGTRAAAADEAGLP